MRCRKNLIAIVFPTINDDRGRDNTVFEEGKLIVSKTTLILRSGIYIGIYLRYFQLIQKYIISVLLHLINI